MQTRRKVIGYDWANPEALMPGFYTYEWDADATGEELVQADEALAATPLP